MSDTQAVEEAPNAQVTPPAAGADTVQTEKIDLDALLAEYSDKDTGGEPAAIADASQVDDAKNPEKIDELLEFVRTQKVQSETETTRRIKEDYDKTVKEVKGDLPLSEKTVSGRIMQAAQEDPRILKAYQFRHKNPEVWKGVADSIRNELWSELKNAPDKASTTTRTQVAEAIQNSRNTADQIADKPLSEMTDAEFAAHHAKFINS